MPRLAWFADSESNLLLPHADLEIPEMFQKPAPNLLVEDPRYPPLHPMAQLLNP